MAALGVDAELCLVDRCEGEVAVELIVVVRVAAGYGHALGGAQEVAGGRGDDPFLAGQKRDLLLALDGGNPVVDLAGEQAQREADDAR